MAMEQVQLRMSEGLIDKVDSLVNSGLYSTRSDVIRDAVRKLVLSKLIGSIPNKKDSVKEVKEIRKKLSKQKFDLNKINKL